MGMRALCSPIPDIQHSKRHWLSEYRLCASAELSTTMNQFSFLQGIVHTEKKNENDILGMQLKLMLTEALTPQKKEIVIQDLKQH